MPPRPAPDLELRRQHIVAAARSIAEVEGWSAVTMRRIASALGVTQPVLYTAVASRDAIVAEVALEGFRELAKALREAPLDPLGRMRAYLEFAERNERVYEVMFVLPTQLKFGTPETPTPLKEAFAEIRRSLPDEDETRAEVAWSTMHGLATLWSGRRLRVNEAEARLSVACAMFTAVLAL